MSLVSERSPRANFQITTDAPARFEQGKTQFAVLWHPLQVLGTRQGSHWITAMVCKAEHFLRAVASRAVLGGLVGTMAWTTPAVAASPVGGLLDGSGSAVINQAKPVGEATAAVVSQPVLSSAVSPPSTPPARVPVAVSSRASAAASPPSSSALALSRSIPRAAALSRSAIPRSTPAAHPVNKVASKTTSVAYEVPSTVARPLSEVKRTATSGTIIRLVRSTAGLLVSRLATPAASASSSTSSLSSVLGLTAESLRSLAVLGPLAAAAGSPITLFSGYCPTCDGVKFAIGIFSTLNMASKGPIGSNGIPASASIAVTAMPGAEGGWGLPPPRASRSTTLIEPTAVIAPGVFDGSAAATAAAESASARAPVTAPPAAPGSGFSSAAGSSSGLASLFLLLAGLLALGAPWTMRVLRPFGRLRRPAPFVLIPERPG